MRENLKALRKLYGFTQGQLAQRVGITTRQYQALESGKSYGSVPIWLKLRPLLGSPHIEYLLEQVDETTKL